MSERMEKYLKRGKRDYIKFIVDLDTNWVVVYEFYYRDFMLEGKSYHTMGGMTIDEFNIKSIPQSSHYMIEILESGKHITTVYWDI